MLYYLDFWKSQFLKAWSTEKEDLFLRKLWQNSEYLWNLFVQWCNSIWFSRIFLVYILFATVL